MAKNTIYARVCHHTRRAFGHAINLHLFRDCVATTIAVENPANVAIAADLLGHTSLEMTARWYIQAQTLEAGRRYQNSVVGLRRRLAQTGNRRT